MKPELNDLRILKLAEMYERAYECFIFEMTERVVKDDSTRQKLRRLISPVELHGERIAAEINRINATLSPEDADAVEHAALLDVLDLERAARAFYLRHIDRLHDPQVVQLFRNLAHEEEAHAAITTQILADSDRRHGRVSMPPPWEDEMRLVERDENGEPPPLREGAGDLGPAHMRR